MEFYICKHCGNIVGIVKKSGAPVSCCGSKMEQLVPGTTDAAQEKHVPTFTVEGNTVRVTVGSVKHPMTAEHLIEWVAIETAEGAQRKTLAAGQEPVATFALSEGDSLKAVYAYCNLHGLWKKDA